MHLNGIPFESVTETHLQQLISDSATESRTLEFKQILPSTSSDEKNEFLRDVVSFANGSGGHIIYGLKEADGAASGIAPIPAPDVDAAIQRLEQVIRAGIEPALHGLRIQAVSVTGGAVIIIEIPKGLFGPHMLKGRRAFVVRGSAGKNEMDFGEIRAAFVGAEAATLKMQDFYGQRINAISTGDTPLPLAGNRKIAIHLASLASFTPGFGLSIGEIAASIKEKLLPPRPMFGSGAWYSLEGMVNSYGPRDGAICYSICFRNGVMELVHSGYVDDQTVAGYLADWFLYHGRMVLSCAMALSLPEPYYLFASLIGVRGVVLSPTNGARSNRVLQPEHILPPPVLIAGAATPVETHLRPVFDLLWNACGSSGCPRYDAAGVYRDMGLEHLEF